METGVKKSWAGGRPKNQKLSDADRKFHRRDGLSAEIEQRKQSRQPPGPNVTVTLTQQHGINGTVYGPGKVELPRTLAQILLDAEQRSRDAQERLHGSASFVIGADHSVRQVPAEMFNGERERELTCEEFWSRSLLTPPEPHIWNGSRWVG